MDLTGYIQEYTCRYKNTYAYNKLMKKEAINLKEIRSEYMEGMGGKKGRGTILQLNYNLTKNCGIYYKSTNIQHLLGN